METGKITILELFNALWPVLTVLGAAFITSLIWFIRLEMKVIAHGEKIKENKDLSADQNAALEDRFKNDSKALWDKVGEISGSFNKLFESIGELKGMIRGKE